MEEIFEHLVTHWESGQPFALATVVSTFRSSPRLPGAAMLVTSDGAALGSVSGGCVEAAVYELAREVLETRQPALERYGISDDDLVSIGLTCGGMLDVFVEPMDRDTFPEFADLVRDVRAGTPVALAVLVDHPDRSRIGSRLVVRPADSTHAPAIEGSLGGPVCDGVVSDDVRGLLAAGHHQLLTYGPDGERRGEGMRIFVWSFNPPPRMIVFGAIDFAAAVAKIGAFLGYRVTVCDARPVFTTPARFPAADEVVVQWPDKYLQAEEDAGRIDGRTVLCVLTHDPKFDVPLLEVALRLPRVGYVGAMGSRRTHDDRLTRLREAGLGEHELQRLCSPIGLDLGARTPEETAVSIAAEIIARQWDGTGTPLAGTRGRIHRDSPTQG